MIHRANGLVCARQQRACACVFVRLCMPSGDFMARIQCLFLSCLQSNWCSFRNVVVCSGSKRTRINCGKMVFALLCLPSRIAVLFPSMSSQTYPTLIWSIGAILNWSFINIWCAFENLEKLKSTFRWVEFGIKFTFRISEERLKNILFSIGKL